MTSRDPRRTLYLGRAGRSRRQTLITAAALITAVFVLRLLGSNFHNEHLELLSGGRQIVTYGELPFRDWIDPGRTAAYFLSAGAQFLFGYRLLGDAILSSALIAAAAALTFLLSSRASGSTGVGLLVTLLSVAAYPRLYNYYKIFLVPLGIFLCWWYSDGPGRRRLVVLALGTAVALTIRQDFGVYLGLGAISVVSLVHWREGVSSVARQTAIYLVALVVWISPFLLFVQLNGGVREYYRIAFDFGQREKDVMKSVAAAIPGLPSFRVDLSAPLIQVDPPAPSRQDEVMVHWARDLGAETRGALEAQYRLYSPRPSETDLTGRTWIYHLADTSRDNISALVGDRNVDDTGGIDRQRRQIRPPPPEPPLAVAQREIPLLRTNLAPGVATSANANVWLFYLYYLVPIAALATYVVRRLMSAPPTLPAEGPKIVSAAVLSAAAVRVLVPHASHARLSDVAPAAAILGAWLIGLAIFARRSSGDVDRSWAAGLRRLCVALLVGITAASVVASARAEAPPELMRLDFAAVPGEASGRLAKLLASPPIDGWAKVNPTGLRALVRYVRECTAPDERVLVTSYRPEVAFYAERAFAGGVPFFNQDHFAAIATQRLILERLTGQSVPVVVADASALRNYFQEFQPVLYRHLIDHYDVASESSFGEDARDTYQVLIDREQVPVRTYRPLNLPCFY